MLLLGPGVHVELHGGGEAGGGGLQGVRAAAGDQGGVHHLGAGSEVRGAPLHTWETRVGLRVASTTSMASWPTLPTDTDGRSRVKVDRSGTWGGVGCEAR